MRWLSVRWSPAAGAKRAGQRLLSGEVVVMKRMGNQGAMIGMFGVALGILFFV